MQCVRTTTGYRIVYGPKCMADLVLRVDGFLAKGGLGQPRAYQESYWALLRCLVVHWLLLKWRVGHLRMITGL